MDLSIDKLERQLLALRPVARGLVGDDADDLVQETWLLAHRRAPCADHTWLRRWLNRTMRNRARELRRSGEARRRREQRSAASTATTPTPEAHAEASELLARLGNALGKLAVDERELLQQRFFEERSAVEIARDRNVPAATVRTQLRRSLRKLRGLLAEDRPTARTRWTAAILAFSFPKHVHGALILAKSKLSLGIATIAAVASASVACWLVLSNLSKASDTENPAPPVVPASTVPTTSMRRPSLNSETADHGVAEDSAERSEYRTPGPPPPEEPPEDASARGEAFRNAVNACFEGIELETGSNVNVSILLVDDPTGEAESVQFFEDELNQIEGLRGCMLAALHSANIRFSQSEFTRVLFPYEVRREGGRQVLAFPSTGPNGPVDADAADPAAVAEKLGWAPRGAEDAKVTVVECTYYDCKFCLEARTTLDRLIADYGDDVAIHLLQMPPASDDKAMAASRAALAAGQQGKFWEMSDLLYDHPGRRSDDDLFAFAGDLGLDAEQFSADMASPAVDETIADHTAACKGNGALGSPSFFINGDVLAGSRPYAQFKTIVDDELASNASK